MVKARMFFYGFMAILAIIACFIQPVIADTKVSALTVDTNPYLTDILYEVKDPSGTPVSRGVTIQSVMDVGVTGINWSNMTGGGVNWDDVSLLN